MYLLEVKSLGGTNFIRPNIVVAVQTNANGGCSIILESGAIVLSSEKPAEIALRIEAVMAVK